MVKKKIKKIKNVNTDDINKILTYKTKKNVLNRFFVILSILIIYMFFAMHYYGLKDGLLVSLVTWSVFVLSTPIADAGFLLDFPVRLFTNIRMIQSEMFTWIFAISLNVIMLIFNPLIYQKNALLKLFHIMLTTPIPYWLIIFISMSGTFLSVYFGDELLDVISHKHRQKYEKHNGKHILIIVLFAVFTLIFLYFNLLKNLGVNL